jgi:PEGA domain-containing protein
VPGSPGEPHRQPSSHDRHDSDWGHGGHGHGHGHGGYYSPYWYGYYGASWWWAPYGYWGWWAGWPYGPYYGYGYPYYEGGPGPGYYGRGDGAGALDLDISPGRTQVYLDGQYIGTVDQYDGFPTYLWLEKGTYDIAFYLDGYTTLARQVSVYPGAKIDMEDRLVPGVSVRPEDLVSKSHERRDARESFEHKRQERIDRGEDPYVEEQEEAGEEGEDWRDRVSREWEDLRGKGEEMEIEDDGGNGRAEHGRVRLEVEPDDASIYLDGKFVGTAQDLANLRNGLLVDPGRHSVAVVRPGREGVEREFEVQSGEELELEIELEPVTR